MTEADVIELIDSSLADEFELDREAMTPEANIYTDLGLDSLDTVDMVIVLEGAFKFKIREEESVRAIRTLSDIHNFVLQKIAEQG
ncbi:phosphopantetheine-binding protein [Geopsychrobacter electrodiphilus]|uniref:phosphopantetheine-binding protein n=1 Tax=Geopsychrobacter electrodiphilus TaxID=225196 RepID=UPI0003628440|nr:phosphopantetheine-binding protein [Geopsychrobacter electrodiphilus]